LRLALATLSALSDGFEGDRPLTEALETAGAHVTVAPWDDPAVDWHRFDRVLIRSTWDYSQRRDEFVAWAAGVGDRLRNEPVIVEWNSDKRYLAELARAGLPVVPTTYVAPGDPLPRLEGDVVVKPSISAGGRDSGRFARASHSDALRLLAELTGAGRTAMVQPFQESVESAGEAALVYYDGELSHTLRKGAVLPPDQVAPQHEALPGLSAARAMFDPELVRAAPAADDELELGQAAVDFLTSRFGRPPLYARVDAVRDAAGNPVLMELELIEPNFYFELAPGAAERLAGAVVGDSGH
jgi:glutathione synthase/RimK-type ligase-like ATP-grasp enzyme